ncbi:B12-binding domain-containing radical SAM protein, partial [candidate division KSB1 bacterium]
LRLVDLNVTKLKDEDIIWADKVFIGAMSIQKSSAREVISRCLQLNRTIIAGGPLFTSESSLFPEVHHLVLNEAEITLPQFLHDLERGKPKPVYRSDQWADIDTTPVPAWDLIQFKHYATMCIQYSRGCPYDCDFCDITVLYGRNPRTKKVSRVISELDSLYRRGWRGGLFFVDDNFIGNRKRIKTELLPAMIDWMKARRNPFRLLTQASINLANDERLVDLMVRAGFETVFVGIETPNTESLIECGKLHNTRVNLLDNVRKLQQSGLQVQGGFIVGFDADKNDIFKRISTFIEESGIVTSMVGLLNALPGTKLYKRLLKENRIIKECTGNNTDFSTNFLPKMDYTVLVDGYKKLVNELYKPEVYYKRVQDFLRNYNRVNKYSGTLSFRSLRAVWMSFFKIGLKRGMRKHFWKLMLWTAFRRPRLIPLALTLAINGYHFKLYFERVVT